MKMRKIFIVTALIIISSIGAFAQFGKNKVQYDEFKWKYIQSLHFDVYYDEGTKYLAEFTAVSAERSLKAIQKTLNHKVKDRITLIVYNSHNEFQQTNVISSFMPEGVGGVTELFKNRVVIPFQGNYSQLDHVIHHELVHAVINDMFYGGSLQNAISTAGGFFIPLWMNEGFAEWQSIGGMDTETDMFMRDLTISEKLPPLNRLNGYLAYRGGQTFYWYVAENYGSQKVGDLINKLRIHKDANTAFKSAFNMDMEEFSEKWERDIKKYYWPDLDVFDDPKDFAVELTDHEKDRSFYNSSPAISPDGRKMAFISAEGGLFGIFVRDIDDKETTRKLVSSFRSQDFEDLNMLSPGISWSRNGKKLAISAKSGGEDAIFIVEEETGDYEKLRFGLKSISSVQWSKDGKELAFVATKDEKSDIFIYNFDSKNIINLTDDVFSENYPVWSPDSRTIYYLSDRNGIYSENKNPENYNIWQHEIYSSDIYKIDVETMEVTRLTYDPENNKTSIAVSPDEEKLLFVSDKNGIGNIYEMKLDNGSTRPITNSINGITQLDLALDASKVLFTVQINGGYDIYMLRYPFDINLEIDELPLTDFKKRIMENQKVLDAIVESDDEAQQKQELIGYGDFEVDFSSQQIVKPNSDVIQEDDSANRDTDNENSASNYTLTDSGFVEKDYKISFSPDLVMGAPNYNTFFGVQGTTQMLFSDELGNHQIMFQANLLIDLRNSQFYLGYYYLPNIIDYRFNMYHTSAVVYGDFDYLYRFRNFGGGIRGIYPFSLFKRLEFGADLMYLEKSNISIQEIEPEGKFLAVPEVRFVHDNTLFGFMGPREGSRYYVGVKGSPKFGDDGVGFATFEGDFRYYIPLGSLFGIAARGAGGASFGPNPQTFFLGGTENWINREFVNNRIPFDDPEDFAFMEFKMPMRGFAVSELTGSRYFLTNFEFRFPVMAAFFAGPIPLIQGMMGAVFYDMGGAWTDSFTAINEDPATGKKSPGNLLMSTGVGLRTSLFGLPFKFDVAWANEYSGWSKPQYLFSLGFDF
jgi:Tol biopolymer transport system component